MNDNLMDKYPQLGARLNKALESLSDDTVLCMLELHRWKYSAPLVSNNLYGGYQTTKQPRECTHCGLSEMY